MRQIRDLRGRVLRRLAADIAASLPPPTIVVPETGVDARRGRKSALQQIEASLEWEALASGLTDLVLRRIASHTDVPGALSIARDDDYSLRFSIDTQLDRESAMALCDGTPGELAEGFLIEAAGDFPSDTVRIPHALARNVTNTWSVHKPRRTLIEIIASQLTITRAGVDEPPAFVTEWFISGPQEFRWTRLSTREHHERLVRTRSPRGTAAEMTSVTRPPMGAEPGQSFSWDHLQLDAIDGVRILVANVPKGHGPSWSSCAAVEYHEAGGATISQEVRDGVAEALGFLFGRQLLRVGRTSFDTMGQPLEEYACNPWGRDAVETSMAPGWSPARIPHRATEIAFSAVARSFLAKREELSLQYVVWTIWIAGRMPAGFELPLYSAALEGLMHAWFKSTRSKSKGVYMPKADFDAIMAETLTQAGGLLQGRQYGDRMIRRMGAAFQMGVNERFEVFFSELGLPFGAGELAVIKARNASAHGSSAPADRQRGVDLARGYQTLLNRVLLKVLGGVDTYTDYSSRGFPERPLAQPIGLALKSEGG